MPFAFLVQAVTILCVMQVQALRAEIYLVTYDGNTT